MKTHLTFAILGGLALAAITALPSLSHAMNLGLDTTTNVDLRSQNRGDDTNLNTRSETDTQMEFRQNQQDENAESNNNDKSDKRSQEERENKNGFFGRFWAMFQGNTDKNHKDEKVRDDSVVVVTGSSTVDANVSVDGPKIYWLRSSAIRENSATIAWMTTERTSSRVWVESDSEIDTDLVPATSDDSFSYFHKIKIDDLESNTAYHFKVASTDKDGNTTISTVSTFTTGVE